MTETSPVGVGVPHQVDARRRRSTTTAGPNCARASASPLVGVEARRRPSRIGQPDRAAAVGRRHPRRAAGPRPVDRRRLPRRPPLARVVHRRRMATHRRRRHHRSPRLHPPGRPHQGRHQVRRRVDQLGRARERAHGPPPGGRGGGRRRRPPRWGERPLACVVLAPGASRRPTRRSTSAFLEARVPKWWLPDDIVFVDHDPEDLGRQVLQEGAAPTCSPRPTRPGDDHPRRHGRRRISQRAPSIAMTRPSWAPTRSSASPAGQIGAALGRLLGRVAVEPGVVVDRRGRRRPPARSTSPPGRTDLAPDAGRQALRRSGRGRRNPVYRRLMQAYLVERDAAVPARRRRRPRPQEPRTGTLRAVAADRGGRAHQHACSATRSRSAKAWQTRGQSLVAGPATSATTCGTTGACRRWSTPGRSRSARTSR